ncbi:hypothetical protein EYB53_020410 [Candidatus Chloroploca sp. M-50]|uniref:Uncharacterized protein n=1 Tax=Candidatus Chloroploca mongolica TaxID=2528176 RepID=A0ABS4DF89_9CHLR|nr:hypothetical protein [Candidatus Chloroploca mongolica]MBP1468088.1 hypothetical protein [Candidatus Chloroploca mongolica]
MDKPPQPQGSQLFTVRLWQEVVAEGQTEWRGKVQHVLSGEVRYFREWSVLITALVEMFAQAQDRDNRGGTTSFSP